MNFFGRGFLRVLGRVVWLSGELAFAVARFSLLGVAHGGMPDRAVRARWLQHLCRRALRVLGVDWHVRGPIPSSGLLVSNHLSYLDILLLGATAPCVFVSKCEVRRWPVFGWVATLAGTLYVRRDKRSDVARVAEDIGAALDEGALVVLFPEGTTSDGREVLPFKSSLLEPATRSPHALAAGCIAYALPDGNVAEEVCYWRDMTLGPHLLNLLGKRGLAARVRFAELRHAHTNRKDLARQLHTEVRRLKETFALETLVGISRSL